MVVQADAGGQPKPLSGLHYVNPNRNGYAINQGL